MDDPSIENPHTNRRSVCPGRIGDCSTNPPTDPDVRISLIRFLGIARFHTIRLTPDGGQPASPFSARSTGTVLLQQYSGNV